jgi:hypothetical protein
MAARFQLNTYAKVLKKNAVAIKDYSVIEE